MKKYFNGLLFAMTVLLCAVSCFDDMVVEPDVDVDPTTTGVYILNSGMMDSNNSELTYFDILTGEVSTNVFAAANGGRRLGDSGNDFLIYGEKMYIALTGSAVVFVTDLKGKLIEEIKVKGEKSDLCPRQMTAVGGKVYVTYLEGYVGAIDTASFNVVKAQVGPYPEGIEYAYATNKLYVAITDGNNYPYFANKIQILDPYSLAIKGEIDVAYNPQTFHIAADDAIYLVSWGDYGANPAALQKINPYTDEVTTIDGVAPTNMTIGANGKAYILSSVYDENWNQAIKYYKYDLATDRIEGELVSSEEVPNGYCIKADKMSGNVFIGTSDYVSNGDIYMVSPAGEILLKFDTGAINPHKIWFANN